MEVGAASATEMKQCKNQGARARAKFKNPRDNVLFVQQQAQAKLQESQVALRGPEQWLFQDHRQRLSFRQIKHELHLNAKDHGDTNPPLSSRVYPYHASNT